MGAIIRYHLKQDPDKMTDDEFAIAWNQVSYILQKINNPKK